MNPFSHGNFTEGLFEASKAIKFLSAHSPAQTYPTHF